MWGGAGVLVLIVASLAWLLYSGYQARSELQSVRQGVQTLHDQISAGQIDAARATAEHIASEAAAAHSHTTGPAWAVGAAVPWLGQPLDSTRQLTDAVDNLASHTLPALVDASRVLSPTTLRRADGSFNLPAIAGLAGPVRNAGLAMNQAVSRLQSTPDNSWLGAVNHARDQLLAEIGPLRDTVTNLGRAIKIVPTVLGADGPRTYMVTFANDAEIRGTDGIAGAFAIVHADAGKVTFTKFQSDNYLVGTRASGLDLGRGYADLYPTAQADYRDSTYSPNFVSTARIWESMWKNKTGQTLNGALVLDPTTLGYLLGVTGPVTLDDGTTINAGNVVAYTQQGLYAKYSQRTPTDQDKRKQYLLNLADDVSAKLLSPGVDLAALLHAAGQGATEHRLLFSSEDPQVESQLVDVPLGGTLPSSKTPYLGLALNNDSQSKLDYYLHARMHYVRSGCGSSRDITVTVQLSNDAPTDLPQYVLGNSVGGTEMLDVTLLGSPGTRFGKVTVNNKPPYGLQGSDTSHPGKTVIAFIPRGRTTQIVYHLTQPAGTGPLVVRDQPMINQMTTTGTDARC